MSTPAPHADRDFGAARMEAGSGTVLRDGALARDIASLGHDHLEAAT